MRGAKLDNLINDNMNKPEKIPRIHNPHSIKYEFSTKQCRNFCQIIGSNLKAANSTKEFSKFNILKNYYSLSVFSSLSLSG